MASNPLFLVPEFQDNDKKHMLKSGLVANAHVLALKPEIKSGSRYLISGRPYTWKDVVDILQKHYSSVPYKLAAAENYPTKVDTTRAETELGIKWASLETIITEVMNQQLAFFS